MGGSVSLYVDCGGMSFCVSVWRRVIVGGGMSLWVQACHCGSRRVLVKEACHCGWRRVIVGGGMSLWVEACHCGWRRVIVGAGMSLWVQACHCEGRRVIFVRMSVC